MDVPPISAWSVVANALTMKWSSLSCAMLFTPQFMSPRHQIAPLRSPYFNPFLVLFARLPSTVRSIFACSSQRISCAKLIKRFVLHAKKTAFIVEHDFIMATYLADRVIVYDGEPGIEVKKALQQYQ